MVSKLKISIIHEDPRVSSCGFYVKYSYLGASPDAIVECKCLLCAREDSLLKVAEENLYFCLQECDNGYL